MRVIILTIAALAIGLGSVAAQSAKTQVRLLLSHTQARQGETVIAAIELQTPPKTHVYWRNPGEAGLPTQIEWIWPKEIEAGKLRWPVPQKFDEAGLVTYGYTGNVLLLMPLKVAQDAKSGVVHLKANVSWLECEEACVPGRANLAATLLIGPESKPSVHATRIADAVARLPSTDNPPMFSARWVVGPSNARSLLLEWETGAAIESVEFFPDTISNCTITAQSALTHGTDGMAQLKLNITNHGGSWPRQLSGVLVQKLDKDTAPKAWEVHTEIAPSKLLGTGKLLKMLALAFLGGLILNVMPCVFPVIALKILGFVQQSTESPKRVFKLGLVSACGVVSSFVVLAIMVILAQQAGKTASWGMHMQNPQFTLLLTVLVTLVALNLFGVFEVTLSGRALDAAGRFASKPGMAGAFMNGMLTTALATPCTAPLLAPALGFAFTQPPFLILAMFIVVGVGLALPYVLLSWHPHWLKFLPKPGPWLERFKVLMGFPMLATAVWLFSFTARRFGPNGPLWLGLFLVALGLAAWTWGQFVQRNTKHRTLATVATLVVLISSYVYALEIQLHWRNPQPHTTITAQITAQKSLWQKWSPEAVANARAAGRPVIVDFTADWCVTCKYNKLVALDTAEVREALQRINAVALVADNTDEDPAIITELRKFDRAGVPLVLVYPRDTNAPPIVLPTLLTKSLVLDALAKAAR